MAGTCHKEWGGKCGVEKKAIVPFSLQAMQDGAEQKLSIIFLRLKLRDEITQPLINEYVLVSTNKTAQMSKSD